MKKVAILGPRGVGKSLFCAAIAQHALHHFPASLTQGQEHLHGILTGHWRNDYFATVGHYPIELNIRKSFLSQVRIKTMDIPGWAFESVLPPLDYVKHLNGVHHVAFLINPTDSRDNGHVDAIRRNMTTLVQHKPMFRKLRVSLVVTHAEFLSMEIQQSCSDAYNCVARDYYPGLLLNPCLRFIGSKESLNKRGSEEAEAIIRDFMEL